MCLVDISVHPQHSRCGQHRKLDSNSSLKRTCFGCRYGISPENIILYGQSIGTVPTVDLASRFECAAVVLHSPLTSGMRVAFPDTKKTYCFDAFPKYVCLHSGKVFKRYMLSVLSLVPRFLTASRRCPKSHLQCSSFTVQRTRSSTSLTAWPCSSAAPKPWSPSGWKALATMTSSFTVSTWRGYGASSTRTWPRSTPEKQTAPPPKRCRARVYVWKTE